ncbi:MAG TPA: 1-deoxy-D-xylulose-5-phosphate reductoisomerase [bacterium]|nr:1-deoxy-D-xylulose-5-phosphate reductoisomerase [bacterium]HQI47806.1 1-deoxy-D-xylulose-5-phosphate reductoisomerase [bacterium]HQJ65429.1 1-deoxy-D-xylulose-5-phosphate reductoisomerase [bacterium]
MTEKRLVILGSTGSIGLNALHVVEQKPERFRVVALSTHQQIDHLLRLAARHRPAVVAITGAAPDPDQRAAFRALGVEIWTGSDALRRLCSEMEYDLLVNAVVGAVGFVPTLAAVELGRTVALANKEALVIGGALVTRAAAASGTTILPIDSEHSAIFQCLRGEENKAVEELLLTGSGGPFRSWPAEEMGMVTVEQALKHPNWTMGRKITIDSATMMNKGLEIIEAHWLFAVAADRIRVVIHPQSIVHSLVAFHDGSVKAQLGVPDMRVPIQLAMTWPERLDSAFPRLDFYEMPPLTFARPDEDKFPALALARAALRAGGSAPAVLNAANEAAVHLFLDKRIGYLDIARLIDAALQAHVLQSSPDAATLLEADRWARTFVAARYSR